MISESRIWELEAECDSQERTAEALRTAAREAAIAENEACALVCRTVANGADAAKAAGASGMSIKQVRWTAEDLEKAIRARREGLK